MSIDYEMKVSKGELSQMKWEALPNDLDPKAVKRCSCCGETLAREYFDEDEYVIAEDGNRYVTKEEKECKLCKALKRKGSYTLHLDTSILSKFSEEQIQEFSESFSEAMENTDIDVRTFICLYTSFSNFLRYTWYHLGLPEPTDAQIHFCDYLQYRDDHTIINAFRGIGKSWITSAFVVWKLWLNIELKILVVSASKERADSFSIFTKRLISELPILHELIPNGERQSNKSFDVGGVAPAHAPSVKSAGITGQITGSRADIIIADDVEVIDNSNTEDAREKLIAKCKDFVSILTTNPKARILFLGTPQTEESIYDKLAEMGYNKFIIPARYPEKIEKYKGYLADFIVNNLKGNPDLVGKSTDPKRFSDDELLKRELMIGASTFALQFQLDTELSDADRYPLKTSDLIIYDLNPFKAPTNISYASGKYQMIKDIPNLGFSGDRYYEAGFIEEPLISYEFKMMVIDPSGRGKDETTYAILGVSNGKVFLIDWGGFQGEGYSDGVLKALADKLKTNMVSFCLIEDNFGDGMFSKLFSPVIRKLNHKCAVEDIKATTNKENRIIDILEPVMNQHRLIVNREVLRQETDWVFKDKQENTKYSLIYQLTHISRMKGCLKHDDRLDALAWGVYYLMAWLNKDVELAVKEAKERKDKEETDELIAIYGSYMIPANKPEPSARSRQLARGGARNSRHSNITQMKPKEYKSSYKIVFEDFDKSKIIRHA